MSVNSAIQENFLDKNCITTSHFYTNSWDQKSVLSYLSIMTLTIILSIHVFIWLKSIGSLNVRQVVISYPFSLRACMPFNKQCQ